jgi:hypothetical protein
VRFLAIAAGGDFHPAPRTIVATTIHWATRFYILRRNQVGNAIPHWTDQLRTNAVFGIDRQNWKSGVPVSPSSTSQVQQVESVHVNLIWSPVKSVNLGIEFMWGAVEYRNLANGAGINGGSRGDASQLRFSAQFAF